MSNIYIQEPPTEGKVLLKTTAGDFDIELWSKETPKACRNFIQLILEGYYNESIFHRCIPEFIVQGGDPTGTGDGGDSIYGKPFKDEIHSRLRFVRRGLVAMANAGANDNGSQFFFTLGANVQELQNKHTIFGKITGDTFYNLSRLEEGEFGKDDRPEYPFKIIEGEILNNPFNDIIPRLKIENEISSDVKNKKKGTKNFKLLSFGDEAEEDEEDVVVATKTMSKTGNSAHDIAKDPSLSSQVAQNKDERQNMILSLQEKVENNDATKQLENEAEESQDHQMSAKDIADKKSRSEIKAEIRKLKQQLQKKTKPEINKCDSNGEDSDGQTPPKKLKPINSVVEQYEQDKAKYVEEKKKLPPKGTSREQQTLALLKRFSHKVKLASDKNSDDETKKDEDDETKKDEDDDESWLNHRLTFDLTAPVIAKDANTKDDTWYDLSDPRNALNKSRREGK